jgi:hypothetical protein
MILAFGRLIQQSTFRKLLDKRITIPSPVAWRTFFSWGDRKNRGFSGNPLDGPYT